MENSSTIKYKLPVFEGPLDMLLTLISKHKLNIYDIEISLLLEQYLEQIDKMQENQMEVASEFIEMASRLVYIKSVYLLPKHEEAEELKKELEGQLIEYQQCRRIAAILHNMAVYDFYPRQPQKLEFDETYTRHHNSSILLLSYISAVGRGKRRLPPKEEAFSGIVARKVVSVNSRINWIMKKLWKNEKVTYFSLFEEAKEKSELVATFLALLELVKERQVLVEGSIQNPYIISNNKDSENGEIEVEKA